MTNGCNGNCFSNYNKDDDNFVVQRLEDIITICEFLIKHEKNSKSRESLKKMLEQTENEEEKDDDDNYGLYINTYKPVKPYWIVPYYHKRHPWWDSGIRF